MISNKKWIGLVWIGLEEEVFLCMVSSVNTVTILYTPIVCVGNIR